ncbi:hypothetical protein PRZ48_012595 [Zasmidium cellare]|uniref:Uncharacterized protein n=1 Tax=Zasmidium cellare TaxID=395010 RepID=A0ABR0E5V1_ZASCE|nr:hypothetical protein PRZ48_012595 [Zasmidium cellare]
MKFRVRDLFRSKFRKSQAENEEKGDKPAQPPTPPRHDSGIDEWHDLMEFPSHPGTRTPVQLVELRRLLSKHEVTPRPKPNPKLPPTLLGLPKDVRTRILDYALPTGTLIPVPDNEYRPREPSILQTSRPLRNEGSKIYYKSNTFHFHIHNFDASALLAWLRDTPSKSAKLMAPIKLMVLEPDGGVECWSNLLQWLECYYKWEVVGLSVDGNGGPEKVEAARRMFREVDRLRKLGEEERPKWKDVVKILEDMRREEKML